MSKKFEQMSLSRAVRLKIGDGGRLYGFISHSSGQFYIAPEVLALMCQIAAQDQKFEINKLTKNLNSYYQNILKNLPDTKECEAILNDLIAAGFILDKQSTSARDLQSDGFGDFWIQWAMLADENRCIAYKKAIESSIQKESLVLDVGAGSGLLSGMCLKAGAKKVIAVEETSIAKHILPLLNRLKLPKQQQKIEIINQNSFDIELTDDITHVVSELFGNDPFQEGVIPTLKNIHEKLSNSSIQPQYIPNKIAVFFELIDLVNHPIKHRIKPLFKINEGSFIDDFLFSAKKNFDLEDISFPMAFSKSDFNRVSQPIELGQLALNPPLVYGKNKDHPLFGQKKIRLHSSSSCLVGLLWFRVYLTPKITISSHPQEVDACEHWSPLVILIQKSLPKDTEVTLFYSLNEEETQMQCQVYSNQLKIGGRI